MITLTISFALLLSIVFSFILWPACTAKKNFGLAALIASVIVIAGVGIYCQIGSWSLVKKSLMQKQQENTTNAEISSLGGNAVITKKLIAHLKEHPKEAQGWYLLGRIYLSQNQFKQASAAFTAANQLQPGKIDILVALAESDYLASNKKEATQYLQQVLKIEPNDIAALNLSALIKFQNKQYPEAIALWQEILLEVPKDSDTATAIEAAIREAEMKMNRNIRG